MTAARILWSAFRNIFADFGQTMRIFALPMLLMALIMAALNWAMMSYPRVNEGLIITPAAMAAICCGLWSTINFHRHILLGERFGWLPRVHWREMPGYGLMAILLGLAVLSFVTAVVLAVIGGTIQRLIPSTQGPFLITFLLWTFATAIGLRLFSLLPGLAIGAPMIACSRTARGSVATILLMARIINLVLIGYSSPQIVLMPYLASVFAAGLSLKMLATQSLLKVLSSVFGISLLTALNAQYLRPTHQHLFPGLGESHA